ncbi:MAG: type II secretion system GspH family protein [Rhodocyclales bacterium]|nr:type II secretion system GspH family protein [Rhodocyclales bacterium]
MRTRGFTLIELLVTLALIGLVAMIALPVAEMTTRRMKESELRGALRQIREAIDAHKQAVDEGRIILRAGDSGYPKSLALLVEGVEDARSPSRTRIHFLRRIPRDPLADPDLKAEETWGKRSYQSPHDRPRAGEDVYDVYSQAQGVGINGLPYRDW